MNATQDTSNPLPMSWRTQPLGAFNASRPSTIDPASYLHETFEYYSIPAYQENQRPTHAKGSDIGSSKLLLDAGMILFGKLNPRVEKVWRVGNYTKHRKIGSTEWLSLIPSNDVDEQFLYFLMWSEHVMPKAKTLVSGSTPSRQRVDARSFYRIEVPLPPLAEQRKIAGVLGLVQRAVEQQERLIALTAELKKALLHQLFTQGLRGEPQKQTEIGPVPESWEVVLFEEFALLQRGFDLPRDDFSDGPYPVVGATTTIGFHDKWNVRGPGVTVVRSGSSAGKPQFVETDFWAHNVVLFVKDFHGHNPKFVYYKIQHLDLTKYREGAAVPTLNRNSFRTIPVAVPKREEQDQFVQALDCVEQKEDVHQRKHAALTALFRTLLHQLMTAQLRVHNLDLRELEAIE